MEAALVPYLFENGPGFFMAGLFFWLWRKEAEAKREIEKEYLANLKDQINTWIELRGQMDASP